MVEQEEGWATVGHLEKAAGGRGGLGCECYTASPGWSSVRSLGASRSSFLLVSLVDAGGFRSTSIGTIACLAPRGALPPPQSTSHSPPPFPRPVSSPSSPPPPSTRLFGLLDLLPGPKTTVTTITITLTLPTRSLLTSLSSLPPSNPTSSSLSKMVSNAALLLIRNQDLWSGASASSSQFSPRDQDKIEAEYAKREMSLAAKYDDDAGVYGDAKAGGKGGTEAVVTILAEVTCDAKVEVDRAGRSLQETAAALTSLSSAASAASAVSAAEIFWLPGDGEGMDRTDVLEGWPETLEF